jgi:aminocarboxymuconate-semialdehyde decarboxylase
MSNRRSFIRSLAAASTGVFAFADNLSTLGSPLPQAPAATSKRREVAVNGKRVKTVDIHAHCNVDVSEIVKGTILEGAGGGGGGRNNDLGGDRLKVMDEQGIDVEALSINAFWYAADQDLARKLIDAQNRKLAELSAAYPGRFVGFTSVALQFPELAAQQMEDGIKSLGLRGAAIGENVNGEELSSPRFDPFWAKAQELDALVFLHPQSSAEATGITSRVKGSGALSNVIGNPLESTIALSHLIFDGTFDRFPSLKICTAHGGGFLPSYVDRMDHGCAVVPGDCKGLALKMKPSEYVRKMYFDSLVFTGEGLRHLVANTQTSHIMVGTDYPFPWVTDPVGHVLSTPTLSDTDRIAILGANACKLLNIPVAVS